MSKMDEQIVAVTRMDLFGTQDEFAFQGFVTEAEAEAKGVHLNHLGEVLRRGDLEEDECYKQMISYSAVYAQKDNSILLYTRIGNGDARLQSKSSIGVGGHVNHTEGNASITADIHESAIRELEEELAFLRGTVNDYPLRPFGFINDDSDEVGRVHFGVVYLLTVDYQSDVEVAETDTLEMSWVSLEELNKAENLENWTKLLAPHLVKELKPVNN